MINHGHTLIASPSLRNQFIEQELKLKKANGWCLTCAHLATLSVMATLAILCTPIHALGQSAPVHPCLNSAAILIRQTLQAPCEQSLESASIETLLDSISSAYEIPIWCDRNIARDQIVSMDKRDESLEIFLNRAIAKADAVLVPLAGIVMVCPKSKCDAVEAAYWRFAVSRSVSTLRALGSKPYGWPDGSTAATAIEGFATRCFPDPNLTIKTEHDIWRGFEFRKTTTPLSIGTCLLSGFDLCLADQDGKLIVMPLPKEDFQVDWTYSKDDIEKKIGANWWKEWRQRWPESSVSKSVKPEGWKVLATVASHRDLVQPMIPKKKWEKPKGEVGLDKKGYSGTFDCELELALRSLAAQTKIEFFPIPVPASLESKRVKLKLDKTPLDDILRQISKQCGVHFKRDGQRIEIIPD